MLKNKNSPIIQDIFKIFETDTFKKILSSEMIEIAQLNAITTLLIKTNIDFDIIFLAKTKRSFASANLTIHIRPDAEITFGFNFDSNSFI